MKLYKKAILSAALLALGGCGAHADQATTIKGIDNAEGMFLATVARDYPKSTTSHAELLAEGYTACDLMDEHPTVAAFTAAVSALPVSAANLNVSILASTAARSLCSEHAKIFG